MTGMSARQVQRRDSKMLKTGQGPISSLFFGQYVSHSQRSDPYGTERDCKERNWCVIDLLESQKYEGSSASLV
jgi:hypothetical protein